LDIDLKKIRDLAKLLHQFELSELEIREGETRVRLRRAGAIDEAAVAVRTPSTAERPSEPPPPPAAAAPVPQDGAGIFYVTSPFVGTFYSSPSPEAPPFVSPGQTVTAGQALCIIEAMKLMNEIEADQAGRVLECLVDNGRTVEYGQKLFRMQKP